MKIARIVTPFILSAVLFILSFLTIDDGGYIWLVFLAIGVVIALFGVLLSARD